ncbi:hypothetical protein CA51_25190 [Rosistilla oblonga]|uniref:hypothetical protein n=1 Tax=Rosistilla oblonga TaxID=2527990 RepID=UPI00118A90A1|nr:hypothetical protein [Rosistilla oblonga]QDV12633.1 hypothetical protein CA51_25190 [Rosistilla oblonga]
MSHLIRSLCFVAVFFGFSSLASADEPTERIAVDPVDGFSEANSIATIVANERLLVRIVKWVDAPAESLFDRRGLVVAGGDGVRMPIKRMLEAKCFVYAPIEELPIEAIYRERLANHGLKVVPVALPSPRARLKRVQESQKQSLIAMLQ